MFTPKFPEQGSYFKAGGKTAVMVPTEKRVRAFVNGSKIADSTDVLILRKTGTPVSYFIPENDVDFSPMKMVKEGNDELGKFELYNYETSEETRADALRLYTDTEGCDLKGYVSLSWNCVDRWMEEDDVVKGHPRDPYTRIDVRQSRRHIEVYAGDEKVADSTSPRMLFETGLPVRYYIPAEDVRLEFFKPSESRTHCPYKGDASYWDVEVGGKSLRDAVWSYFTPYDEAMSVKGYFCFYGDKFDRILVDGQIL